MQLFKKIDRKQCTLFTQTLYENNGINNNIRRIGLFDKCACLPFGQVNMPKKYSCLDKCPKQGW